MTEEEWLASADPEPMLVYLGESVSDRKVRLFGCACCRRAWHLLADARSRLAVEVAERFAEGLADEAEFTAARDAADQAEADAWREDYLAEARAHFCTTAESARINAGARGATAARVTLSISAAVPDRGPFSCSERCAATSPGGVTRRDPGEDATAHGLIAYAIGEMAWVPICKTFGFHDPEEQYGRGEPPNWGQRWMQVLQLATPAKDLALASEQAAQADLLRELFGNPFRLVSLELSWLAFNDGAVPKLAKAITDRQSFDLVPILADALEDAGCTSEDILAHLRGPGPHVRGCWVIDLLLGKS